MMKKSFLKGLTILLIVISVSSCNPVADCTNGVKDGTETGIDCGGDCPACAPISSCTDGIMNGDETGIDCGGDCDDCPVYGKSMHGTYSGTITGDLRLVFPPVVNLDTTFVAPGPIAEVIIGQTIYTDSISVNLKMTIDGTPLDIILLAHIDTETSFTIPLTIYSYLGAVPMRANGSGSVLGNTLNSNIMISESDGTTDAIFGDLNFTGTK